MRGRVVALALCAAAAGCSDDPGETSPTPTGESGAPLWGRSFGKSIGMDAVALAVDSTGAVIVGGRFFATTDFGGGPVTSPANNWQAYVAKYDGDGALLWFRSLGDIFEEQVTAVAVDPAGGVYVAGNFRGNIDLGGGALESEQLGTDLFVAKLGSDGSHSWSKRFGGPGFESLGRMEVDAQGGLVFTGSASDGTDFGGGPVTFQGQPFIAKLQPTGALGYVTTLDHAAGDYFPSVSAFGLDSSGAVVLCAMYYGEFGGEGLYVAKLDDVGTPEWVRDFPSIGQAAVEQMQLGADDAIFISGTSYGYIDLGGGVSASTGESYGHAFVAGLAPDATPRWIRDFAPQSTGVDEYGNPMPAAVVVTDMAPLGGGVVLTGGFLGRLDFGGGARESVTEPPEYYYYTYADDVFAVSLDKEGEHVWDTTFGNSKTQAGTSVGVDPLGNVLVAGWSNGGIPVGTGEVEQTPYYDSFLVKLSR